MELTNTVQQRAAAVSEHSREGVRPLAISAVFTVTMFTGAALLFLVQPMFAKLVLPRLGGSPSVWNTCMVFFQAALLLGYAYAHWSAKRLGVRRQALGHLALLLTPFICLPISLSFGEPSAEHPVFWLLSTMTLAVGLPFFVVSTTAPLLQRWYATLPLASSHDPYFLYAASNLGSVLSLLAYPLLVEPMIGVQQQAVLWTVGYVLLVALNVCCVCLVRAYGDDTRARTPVDTAVAERVPTRQRIAWVVLSFLPSSLMLGVTSYITADLASVPLFWVLPLALYLLTFVIVFSRRRLVAQRPLAIAVHVLIVVALLTVFVNSHRWTLVPFHLVTFFATALACHYELASRRPGVSHLTEYYLWLSVGGVLGGIFNSLVAPQVFSTVLEYPLVLGVVPLVLWVIGDGHKRARQLAPEIIAACACLAAGTLWFISWPSQKMSGVALAAAVGLSARIVLRPKSLAPGVVTAVLVLLISSGWFVGKGTVLFTGRSFFGVHRVVEAEDHTHRLLFHGSTVHGRQELNAGDCPLSSYYFPNGPMGQVMSITEGRRPAVAVVGLGSGTLACYAGAGESWTFYEIDPMMDHVARYSGLLTQIKNSRGEVSVVIGDGRLKIQSAAPGAYNVIVLDAFSSDAVPIHLLTREALRLYLSRLAPDGLLVANISNRYVNLRPTLARTARLEGLEVRTRFDGRISENDGKRGRSASHWMVMSREAESLRPLDELDGWSSPPVDDGVRPWTDDYSNILQALMFR